MAAVIYDAVAVAVVVIVIVVAAAVVVAVVGFRFNSFSLSSNLAFSVGKVFQNPCLEKYEKKTLKVGEKLN